MTRVAINGFGRIGRAAFKVLLTKRNIKVVAINDLTDPVALGHLLKYDTVYGRYSADVKSDEGNIIVDGKKYRVTAIKEPEKLPWKEMGVDVAIESTGRFANKEDASRHLKAGAKKVVISAPVKAGDVKTYLIGVNAKGKIDEDIISNASCTTNCVGPVTAVIEAEFGIKKAVMTTIHSYTADQNLVDGPHKDLRRARAAAENIVPTSTGAAVAVTQTIPKLEGLFDGLAIRVPTSIVSLSDFTFLVNRTTNAKEVNSAFTKAASLRLYKGILEVTDEPLVSSDFIGNPASAIVDLSLTNVVGGDLVKVVAWYDNEWGYANRLVELVEML